MATSETRPDAVVFDMDGVLFDSEPLHLVALNAVLAEDGIVVSDETNRELLGRPVEDVISELFARRGLDRSTDTYMERYDTEIVRIFREHLQPAVGVREVLEMLRGEEVRLALASSSRHLWIEAALSATRLRGFFEIVVSAEDVAKGKPDPDVYLLAADRLAVAPNRLVAVEDSPAGVLAGKRAGMTVIAVRTPYTEGMVLEGADRVVEDVASLALSDFELGSRIEA